MQLETSRLILKPATIEHAAFYYALFNSEGWLTNIGDRNIKNIADAVKVLKEKYEPSFTQLGYGTFTIFLKETNVPIGTCGIYKRDTLDHPDIGFAFLDGMGGKGYGFESASKMIQWAETNFNFQKLFGFTVPNNVASIKLLEKLGLSFCGTFTLNNENTPLLLYSKEILNA